MRKMIKKMISLLMATTLVISFSVRSEVVKAKETSKDYIVTTITTKKSKELEQEYSDSRIGKKSKSNVISLTNSEVSELAKDKDVIAIESNIVLTGSGETVKGDSWDWNIEMINAEDEFESGEKIKVAVIDSGVNYNSSINVTKRINLVDGEDGMSPLYEDYSGHGTAIAGIIAGQDENGYQVGVDSTAEVISIKVLDEKNSATVDKIIEAIYIAIEEKVNIINMSFGTTTYSEALHTAIKDAKNSGILIVAAAGNRGMTDNKTEYPAAFEEVLSVGSVDSSGQISDSSSSNTKVDVYAPGEMIRSTAIFDGTMVCSGTSMAVPHVVGVASKIWSKDKGKDVDFIKGLIIAAANETTDTKIVDLEYALDIYDEYSTSYKDNEINPTDEYDENEELVISEIDENLVEGSWSKDKHQNTVERYTTLSSTKQTYSEKAINLMVAGIRLADDDEANLKFYVDGVNMHCWWHAGTVQLDGIGLFVPNYFATMEFIQRVIKTKDCNISKVSKPAGMTNYVFKEASTNLGNAIAAFDFTDYNYTRTDANTRFVYYGILMHVATDLFAHRVSVKLSDGNFYYINNKITGMNTDNVNDLPERYSLACWVVKSIMDNCINPDKPYQSKDISLTQFTDYPVMYSGNFKIHNYYEFAVESGWSKNASESVMTIIKQNSQTASYNSAVDIDKILDVE